ncbi:227 kDa spindle- and centromere-associated protein-like isoform X2 [Halichondria panicea]
MRRLQSELKDIDEEADQSEKTHEVLKLHNEVLESQQTSLKSKHSSMVKKLNDCMGKKSKMQIKLNETQDKLNSTNTEIQRLESEMMKLEQDMIQAKLQFDHERSKLSQQTADANEKCAEKNAENQSLTKELNNLKSEVVETALIVCDKNKALHDVEASIRMLTALEDELKRKLEEGEEKTKRLQKSCTSTEQETVKMRADFASKKAVMLEKTLLFQKEFESEAVTITKLQEVKKALKRDHKLAQEGSAMQSRALKGILENVNGSKRTLLYQAEEGAKLEAENKDLHFRIAQLKESHAVNVQLLKDEMTDGKVAMDKERKTREVVEETYNALQAQLVAVKVEHTTNIAKMATDTADAHKNYSDMCDKAASLEKELEVLGISIMTISRELSIASTRLNSMRTTLTEKVHELEQNIADMTDEITDRDDTLSEIEPVCDSLESDFKEKGDHYETKKKDIIALKSKRSELDDGIKRIERDLEKIHLPQEKLRMESLRCRTYTRQRLRERVIEVEEMEMRVVEARKQLAAITNENERIEKASDDLSNDIEQLKTLFAARTEVEKQLDDALRMHRSKLSKQWKDNEELEKTASKRDEVLLSDLTRVKKESEKRLEKITSIHEGFDRELQEFTDYLTTAAIVDSMQ